jgi:FlaA1/EpsC-like NDP-sugar epimerase
MINPETLLGRKRIPADNSRVGNYLTGKTVLITGAAGSVGSELARRMVAFSPERVLLLDCAESALYELDWEIRHFFPTLNFEPVLGNVSEFGQMEKVFSDFRPDVVFHAAAYKQVPLLEKYPEQAILTNLIGTRHIADLCHTYGAEKMIFISTDKAVNPVSVMGISKRYAEVYLQLLSREAENRTQFVITRFGNVLGSSGSVVPLFEKQIAVGGPVTVTHPEMTRYFMAISEAAQFVLEAGNLEGNGRIFWFNIASPVNIASLAKRMIEASGKTVEMIFTGIRPGEKLQEEWQEAWSFRRLEGHPHLLILEPDAENDLRRMEDDMEELMRSAGQL